jgi:hypothetical protein
MSYFSITVAVSPECTGTLVEFSLGDESAAEALEFPL